jgi:hypothetical protein
VTLDLAAHGVEVVALDVDQPLLAALECRAVDLPVATVLADARDFHLGRRFSLIVVPMQTLQLFEGCAGRRAFFRTALAHLIPGGILAAAVADAMDCFDDEHDMPPPPEAREILGTLYTSQLLGVTDDGGRAAIHRRRQVAPPDGEPETIDVMVHLDRVSADDVATEAHQVGFMVEPRLEIPETEEYLGSTVVVLRAPSTVRRRRPELTRMRRPARAAAGRSS